MFSLNSIVTVLLLWRIPTVFGQQRSEGIMLENIIFDNVSCSAEKYSVSCGVYLHEPFAYDLSWKITYPGLAPVNIEFDRTTQINQFHYFERGIQSYLSFYDRQLTGLLTGITIIPVLNSHSIHGTVVQCGNSGNLRNTLTLTRQNAILPQPPSNIGFNFSAAETTYSSVFIIPLIWNIPQGSDDIQRIPDYYDVHFTSVFVDQMIRTYTESVNISYLIIGGRHTITVSITAFNCVGSATAPPFIITLDRCVRPLLSDGMLDPDYVATRLILSDTQVIPITLNFVCNSDFIPSVGTATCGRSRTWEGLRCGRLEANTTLVRNPDIVKDFECQGDMISYTCAVFATSNVHTLTWTVTYQGLKPIIGTHYNITGSDVSSSLNLDMNAASTLTMYRSLSILSKYIESVLTLQIEDYVPRIRLNCSFLSVFAAVRTLDVLVPLAPTNFRIVGESPRAENTTVIFEWVPPEGSGPEAIVDYYTISISPTPLSHPITTEVSSPPWSVTLGYNINYTAEIVSFNSNCVRGGIPSTISFVGCMADTSAIVRRVTGFSAVRSYPEATHITATFEWGPPPQSIGVKSTAIYYRLSISPAPLNYPDTVEITDLSWNVSLEYNTNYTASITAVNCLSENSDVSIISAFFNIKDYVFCDPPDPPVSGSLESPPSLEIGSVVLYKCDPGLIPDCVYNATCSILGQWEPPPDQHICAAPSIGVLVISGVAPFVIVTTLVTVALFGPVAARHLVNKRKAKPKAEPKAEPEADPEAEPEAKPEAESEAKPEVEPEAEPEAETEAKPEAKPEANIPEPPTEPDMDAENIFLPKNSILRFQPHYSSIIVNKNNYLL